MYYRQQKDYFSNKDNKDSVTLLTLFGAQPHKYLGSLNDCIALKGIVLAKIQIQSNFTLLQRNLGTSRLCKSISWNSNIATGPRALETVLMGFPLHVTIRYLFELSCTCTNPKNYAWERVFFMWFVAVWYKSILPITCSITVYPKKYAHGFCFAVLCCGYTLTDFPISIRLTSLALWQSNDCPSASKATLMNMDKYFMWIHYERLHNHNKAKRNKTVCIFLGIYCTLRLPPLCWWSNTEEYGHTHPVKPDDAMV